VAGNSASQSVEEPSLSVQTSSLEELEEPELESELFAGIAEESEAPWM